MHLSYPSHWFLFSHCKRFHIISICYSRYAPQSLRQNGGCERSACTHITGHASARKGRCPWHRDAHLYGVLLRTRKIFAVVSTACDVQINRSLWHALGRQKGVSFSVFIYCFCLCAFGAILKRFRRHLIFHVDSTWKIKSHLKRFILVPKAHKQKQTQHQTQG